VRPDRPVRALQANVEASSFGGGGPGRAICRDGSTPVSRGQFARRGSEQRIRGHPSLEGSRGGDGAQDSPYRNDRAIPTVHFSTLLSHGARTRTSFEPPQRRSHPYADRRAVGTLASASGASASAGTGTPRVTRVGTAGEHHIGEPVTAGRKTRERPEPNERVVAKGVVRGRFAEGPLRRQPRRQSSQQANGSPVSCRRMYARWTSSMAAGSAVPWSTRRRTASRFHVPGVVRAFQRASIGASSSST